ncbi:MAG TPA: tail fiber protein [Acetobacteraceae bacterium]|jgi:microcystin-dependent protein|nr:tail fiber protein [Acetobacteraceae bacterium]
MSEPFLGQITIYPYSFPPYQWADCAGQLMAISQNAALFSLLGTNFGGNGTSTFGLPDLQGRVGINQGNAPGGSQYFMGEDGGNENVTLLANNLAVHSHSLNATTAHGSTQSPGGNLLATGEAGAGRDASTASIYNAASPNTALTANSIAPAGGSSGGTQPHNNVQSFLVLRYCIALAGVFPSRG